MLPILPLQQFEVGTPDRRLAQFLNAWAARDWERMARNCVALYRKNPGYSVQRLKSFFGQRLSGDANDTSTPSNDAAQGNGVDLISAEIILSKSKGPYAKVAAAMNFVRRGNAKNTFGEVFSFELIRERKEDGNVDPLGAWFVIPKFEVYAEQCFDADHIFGAY